MQVGKNGAQFEIGEPGGLSGGDFYYTGYLCGLYQIGQPPMPTVESLYVDGFKDGFNDRELYYSNRHYKPGDLMTEKLFSWSRQLSEVLLPGDCLTVATDDCYIFDPLGIVESRDNDKCYVYVNEHRTWRHSDKPLEDVHLVPDWEIDAS